MSTLQDLAERVERLLLRHDELRRTHALLETQCAAVTTMSGAIIVGDAVAANGGDYTFYQSKRKGNPIEIVYPKEGVPLVVSPTAITSFARTPLGTTRTST